MVDNVTIPTTGAGTATPVVATDDVAGIHYQRVKIDLGGDGLASPLVRGQQTKANSLPVTLASDEDTLVISGTVTANAGSGTLLVDGSAVTQPVSGTVTANAGTGTLLVDGSAVTQPVSGTVTANAGTGTLLVDGSAVTQPVSGTVTADAGTGSLTVNAPVATPVNVQVSDGTRTATVRDTGASDSLNVAIVDAAGAQITSFGGGTQFAEDTTHVSGDLVTMAGVVQQAADTALSNDNDRSLMQVDASGFLKVNVKVGGGGGVQFDEDTTHVDGDKLTMAGVVQKSADGALSDDNDRSLLQVDASGFLKVNIKAGGGSGGTALADEAAFTEGTTSFTPVGGVLNDTIVSDPTEDQAAAMRITPKRAVHVHLRDQAGVELATAAAPLRIDPTGTTTQPVSGTVTANAGSGTLLVDGSASPQPVTNIGVFAVQDDEKIADNTAFVDGTTPLQPNGYVFDDVAGVALTENDLAAARIDSKRAQVLVIEDATTRGRGATVSAANALKVDGSAVTQPVSGTVTADVGTGTRPVSGTVTADAGTGTFNMQATAGSPGSVRLSDGAAFYDGTKTAQLPAALVGGRVDVVVGAVGSGVSIEAVGDIAHDIAAGGNPVLIGVYAETPDDSAPGNQVSADADVVRLSSDRDGALYTHPHPPRIWHVATEYTTTQTDTTVKAAPGASLSLYITDIYIACNAAVTVTLEEGTTTLKFRYYGGGQGDGVSKVFQVPMKLTANTLLSVTTSAAVTVMVVVNGYTAP